MTYKIKSKKLKEKKYYVIRNWVYKGKTKKEVSRPLEFDEARKLIKITEQSGKNSWFNIKKIK